MDKVNLKLIKARRKELNLTQKDLAKELGYKSKVAYSLKESGKRKLIANEIPILCRVLKLTLEEIYTGA